MQTTPVKNSKVLSLAQSHLTGDEKLDAYRRSLGKLRPAQQVAIIRVFNDLKGCHGIGEIGAFEALVGLGAFLNRENS